MKKIVIDFGDNGDVRLETQGFAGKSCKVESEFIKKALGNVVNESLSADYYRDEEIVDAKCYRPLCG